MCRRSCAGRARNGRWNGYQMRAWRFLRVQRIDDFTIELLLLRKDVLKAEAAAQKAMCELAVVREMDLERRSAGSGDGGFLCWGCFSVRRARLWSEVCVFYDVVGNETVPDAEILRALHSLGVGFGTYGPDIQPQALKNKMLLLCPGAAMVHGPAERYVRARCRKGAPGEAGG